MGADSIRIATWNAELMRRGPGLLLRDILRGEDPQIAAFFEVLRAANADVVLLQGIDHDLTGEAIRRLAGTAGYSHVLTAAPNSGIQTGLDVDNDGRKGEPEDALGFGRFRGEGGMAVLSRLPLGPLTNFNDLLWKDLPDSLLPAPNDTWPNAATHAALPLASISHWLLPVTLPDDSSLTLMAFHNAPPVFDGPEDRNGRRNHDQLRFWKLLLDGDLGDAPQAPFVLLGDANLDPTRAEGRKVAIRDLLADPRLQDPQPSGPHGRDTVDWEDPGRLRVSYILPDAGLTVLGSGVLWPLPDDPFHETVTTASRHRLVWVDIALP